MASIGPSSVENLIEPTISFNNPDPPTLHTPAGLAAQDSGCELLASSHELPKEMTDLNSRALFSHRLFEELGDIEDLDSSIKCFTEAIALIPDGHSEKPKYLGNLGVSYADRFEWLGDIKDLEAAINCHQGAAKATSDDHCRRCLHLTNLVLSYITRFEHLDEPEDLGTGFQHATEAVRLAPNGDSIEPLCLKTLGVVYKTRFDRFGDLGDLNAAIDQHQESVRLTSDEDSDKPSRLHNLSQSYESRFEELGELEDLDAAIQFQTKAVLLAPSESLEKPAVLGGLGSLYHSRFERTGHIVDLNVAIDYQTEALRLTSEGSPCKPGRLNNLRVSHITRFERLGELADLNLALQLEAEAVELTPHEHPDRPLYLLSLGKSYGARYDRLEELADLHRAVDLKTEAVQLLPENHHSRPFALDGLGYAYNSRYERLGQASDIDSAIKLQTEAVSLVLSGHPNQASYLHHLGKSHSARFQQLGELTDLNVAIDRVAEAVRLTSDEHPDRTLYLNSLGISYHHRFERIGQVTDIDAAIKCQLEVLLLVPSDHPARSPYLTNLGLSYHVRFLRLGELADLDSAIKRTTEAISHLPDEHPDKPLYLGNLGISYHTRFQKLGSLADVDAAIELKGKSVLLVPTGHPHMPSHLDSLGESYLARFNQTGDSADVNAAIRYQSEAVQVTASENPDKALYLDSLGISYYTRFEQSRDCGDLDLAIKHQSEALLLWPDEHPDRLTCLHRLGKSHRTRYEQEQNYSRSVEVNRPGEQTNRTTSLRVTDTCSLPSDYPDSYPVQENFMSDITKSLHYLKQASKHRAGSPINRMLASVDWAYLAHRYRHPECLEAYASVIELVPQVAWLGSTVHRRYKDLAGLSMTPMEAAAAAIEQNRYDLALEWLEEGRSIVWSQILQLRAPLDLLYSVDIDLATAMEQVAFGLETIGSRNHTQIGGSTLQVSQEEIAREHRSLALRWEQLVASIRKLPRFERFLLPKKHSELVESAPSTTFVMVNIHRTRCDALTLTSRSSKITHIPLPSFSQERCMDMRNRLLSALQGGGIRARTSRRPIFELPSREEMFESVLAALWIDVVHPILNALGYLEGPPVDFNDVPRVTWCTTGPLAFLPLHAAGLYDRPLNKTLDYVISSYAPTLSTLSHAPPLLTKLNGILAVGQADLTGSAPLAGTIEELDRIQEQAGSHKFTRLAEEAATPAAVLSAMKQHSWVHLACHASQNLADPAASAFILHKGHLDLATITREQLPNAQLAFLSACETAMGDEGIPDEAVHLAAGMLMSGYRTVIATMWPIHDSDAPIIAGRFYSQILENDIPNTDKSAKSLHKAVEHLRSKTGEQEFWRWVPYIHMGC
ncbi:hypothetical protein FRC12_021846 [Ceratobasidium sp. 428]|nr:hypothetical protein FRC12_021846 [Ceratobasidium sp. 428]